MRMGPPVSHSLLGFSVLLLVAACGSSDDTSPEDAMGPGMSDDDMLPTDEIDPEGSDPMETPPGPDSAYTGTGPCDFQTEWAGDDRCIEPPPPDEGFQLHVGPSDYDNPDDIAQFLLPAGEETVECFHVSTTNEADIYNQKRRYRMRPGTHHLILKHTDVEQQDGWGPCPEALSGSWGGAQNSITDSGFGDVAPEDAGFASLIEADTRTAAELHYVNTGNEPILREVWANFYSFPEDQVTGTLRGIALIGGLDMALQPGDADVFRYRATNDLENRRVYSLVGHAHSHTTRFTSWKVTADGERQLVYESFNWAEPESMLYNTVTENPEPDATRAIDGGHTGQLFLAAGDSIEWECEVFNDLDTVIRFANEAFTGEMCIQFGSTPDDRWQSFGGRQ